MFLATICAFCELPRSMSVDYVLKRRAFLYSRIRLCFVTLTAISAHLFLSPAFGIKSEHKVKRGWKVYSAREYKLT